MLALLTIDVLHIGLFFFFRKIKCGESEQSTSSAFTSLRQGKALESEKIESKKGKYGQNHKGEKTLLEK